MTAQSGPFARPLCVSHARARLKTKMVTPLLLRRSIKLWHGGGRVWWKSVFYLYEGRRNARRRTHLRETSKILPNREYLKDRFRMSFIKAQKSIQTLTERFPCRGLTVTEPADDNNITCNVEFNSHSSSWVPYPDLSSRAAIFVADRALNEAGSISL